MDRIKRFITCLIPVHLCNFRCEYCYLSHKPQLDPYNGGISDFIIPPKMIAKSLSPVRLDGYCYFNLCAAGETMMHPQLVELVSELTLQGHYVDIVTNGTISKRFDELIGILTEEQKERLFIKFSFHYLELKKKNLMNEFIENVNKIKSAKISYSIEITPHDELVPYIDEIKSFSIEKFGAWPHITVARNEGTKEIALLTKYSREQYKNIWEQFDSALFDFKLSLFNVKRCEFCYAGQWSLSVDLETGYYTQCYIGDRLGNIKDLNKPLNFRAIGRCKEPHCFNGHAFLGCGNIPELTSPTYTQERDRIMTNGEHWFQPKTREFFNSKLSESNDMYSEQEKQKIIRLNKVYEKLNVIQRGLDKISNYLRKR